MKLRTKYLINPQLQYSVLVVATCVSILTCAMVFSVFGIYFRNLQSTLQGAGILPGTPIYDFISLQKGKVEIMIYLISFVVTVLNIIVLTVLTHKIAGPIYKIEKGIKKMIAGDWDSPIKVRQNDFFKDTAELVDQLRINEQKNRDNRKAG